MAPKNKFTREEMIAAALKIVRRSGTGSLTAKAIADELGISTRPVFTCFGTMDTVKNEVRQAAEEIYNGYIGEGLKEKIPFFGLGMQYIRFAKEEPELYRLLFLMQTADGSSGAFQSMVHSQETARGSLVKIYNMTEAEADRFFSRPVVGGPQYCHADCNRLLSVFRQRNRKHSHRLQHQHMQVYQRN